MSQVGAVFAGACIGVAAYVIAQQVREILRARTRFRQLVAQMEQMVAEFRAACEVTLQGGSGDGERVPLPMLPDEIIRGAGTDTEETYVPTDEVQQGRRVYRLGQP